MNDIIINMNDELYFAYKKTKLWEKWCLKAIVTILFVRVAQRMKENE